jgi:xanthine dehydrogenase YagR molybdenum-binding subunit
MSIIQDAAMAAMKTAVRLTPERWLPGGTPDPLIGKHGAIGSSAPRVDGPRKVQGQARFAAEVPAQGLTYVALLYSTIARGEITEIDTGAAETAPGVVLVMTHRNAPRMKPPAVIMTNQRAAGATGLSVMQDARIHWNGEPVALILAETQEQADYARRLVRVTYREDTSQTSFQEAKAEARYPDSVMGEPAKISRGDAEAALAKAAVKVDNVYTTPFMNHAAIEPHAATLWWEGEDLVIHDTTQMLNSTRWTLAGVFGIDEANIRITSPFVGGGFGGKGLWHHHMLAIAAAKLSGRPVRVALSREGVFRAAGGRTCTEQRVALAAEPEGPLTALIHTGTAAMTPHNNCPEQFTFPARHLYAVDSYLIEQKVADLDMVANTFMRAPGEAVGTFALECALDELAEKLGVDPIDLRARLDAEQDATSGTSFSQHDTKEAFRRGAERFGWSQRNPQPRSRRDGEWWIGLGCATGTYPYQRMQGAAARITLTRGGHATVATAAHEMGMGTATAQSQAAADRLGLPLDEVTFEYGDTALPSGSIAGGSSQTVSIAAAVSAATDALIGELLKLAGNDSPIAGLKAEEVELRDGGIAHAENPGLFETYASILARSGRDEVSAEAEGPMPLEMLKYSMHSTSAVFAEVAVNAVTGEPRVRRLLGSFDCGRILNPKTAASQFRGGMIMGIGLALSEAVEFDARNGRVMNPSLAEYHVPVHLDVPEIEVIWNDIPDPHAPLGARGIGEIGITGTGAAIANAVYNATGRRVRDLPITLDKLL